MKSMEVQGECIMRYVAPRAGGRGLKSLNALDLIANTAGRPPRRGAWIEIAVIYAPIMTDNVAPRAGGRGLKLTIAPTR